MLSKEICTFKEGNHDSMVLLTVLKELKARGMDDQDLLELIRSSKK